MDSDVPPAFRGWYDPVQYRKSQQYLQANTRFKWVSSAVSIGAFLIFWFCGGFALLDQWVRALADAYLVRGLIYIGALYTAGCILSVPTEAYQTFVIEARYGFNTTTPRVFVSDWIKKYLLGLVIGGMLVSGILWFFEHAGANAWLYCWIAVTAVFLVMQYIVPTWIMPLFNRFDPLPDAPLKNAILDYAAKINFPLRNVYVMDGSRRSKKSNAFFAGFGRHRRIVLFDTLIENLGANELVAVLAHEIGHYKKKHVLQMMAGGILQAGLMLYLLSLFISAPMLFDAFFMINVSVYAGLVFFAILYSPIEFFIGLAIQELSRKNEYAADRFAVETTRDPESLKAALKKLAAFNLSNLACHPLYVVLNYSHPPMLLRLEAIEREAG
ncbi:MAG: M48 family metallopeptidase [Desulfobacterales bacterium]|nr:M48 family metallopeptidase [Desulfobacterales bacterium]MBS3756147.1 M48 family metallopeptidase [Desulfobacterales bacterium]